MTVQVVTDSGADIPKDLAEELKIEVVPLTVSFGSETFQDGVDLSGDEFYYRLTQQEIMPTTSQPSVGSFVEIYKKIKDSSAEILSIHLSSKLSGTLDSAKQAAAVENLETGIRLIDSQAASMGLGFSVLAAAEAAKNGASLEDAAVIASSVLDRTHLFILFDTLKFLEKGGRIGKARALMGNILNLKPILTLEDGEIAKKLQARSFRKGIQSLQQLIEDCGPLEELAVLYTTDPQEASNLGESLSHLIVGDKKPMVVRISPAVGAHGGPGVVGVVGVAAKP